MDDLRSCRRCVLLVALQKVYGRLGQMCASWFAIYSQGPNAMWPPDDPGIDFEGIPMRRNVNPVALFIVAAAVLLIFYAILIGV